MICLTNTPIVEWDDREQGGESLIRVPYMDIEEIVTEVGKLDPPPRGLIPPYKEYDQGFNARSASVVWGRLPRYSVLMPVATSNQVTMQDFVTATLKAGFKNLVVPYLYGYNKMHRFDQLMQFLHGIYDDETWIHVAGGAPELPDHWPGIWSWSEEEL